MRHRVWLLLGLGALLVGGAPRLMGEPAATTAADDKLTDYRGKGEINVTVPVPNQDAPLNLTFQMEQVFLKPRTILLKLILIGAGLRQTFLTDGEVEQSYNPVQGLIVEKRFKNLDKSTTSPLTALQASMYDLGQKIKKASSRHGVGSEKQLGYECDVVELDSKELFLDVSADGILGGQPGAQLRNGRTKVWLMHDTGLPVRIELYAGAEKPALTVSFTELKVNAGVERRDMHLDAPNGTRKVSVTADLADPGWEAKMESELRDLVTKASQEKPEQKRSLAP